MKISGNYRFYRWFILRGLRPPAEKWAFISQKLIFGQAGKI
jgi:hypothetical protein